MSTTTLVFILFWIVCGIASAVIASSKGRDGGAWALLGFILGPIGVLMAIGVTSQRPGELPPSASDLRKCPACAEQIRREAVKCRFCGTEVQPLPPLSKAAPATGEPLTQGNYHLLRINCAGCNAGRPREGYVASGGKQYCAECVSARGLVGA